MEKAKEVPSVTKPLTTNGDARTVHPGNRDFNRDQGHTKEGYSKVGSYGKTGKAEKPHIPERGKSYERENPYVGEKNGYSHVGKKAKEGGPEPRDYKNTKNSPWRNA